MLNVEYAKYLFYIFTIIIFILCFDYKKCNEKKTCSYLVNIFALCLSVMLIPLSEIFLNHSEVQHSSLNFIIRCVVSLMI
ncbi:hypothetical protein, partial [Ursidibacter sp. B-7004-1]